VFDTSRPLLALLEEGALKRVSPVSDACRSTS
jgi:hypothetical protein